MQTKFPIRMHKDILALFVLKQYKENLTELHNEVRQVCSKAFLDACNSSLNILAIGFQHLSVEMSSLTNDSPLKLTISRILSALPNDYLLIDEKGNSSAIDYFRDASKDYGLARINNFICEFNTDIETIDNIQDYVTENLSILTNCGNTQLNALKNSINPITYQLFLKAITDKTTLNNFNQYPTLFYGSLIHVSNLIKRIENYSYSTGSGNDQPYTKNIYANEYQDAEGIIRSIENLYHCQISSREIDFITLYFAIANQCANKSAPSIILLSHGPDIAKTMEIFIKKEFPSEVKIIGIDYQPEMQFNDLLEITAIRAHELDNGAGILIIADFEPLLSVSDYLRINENIKSRTLSPLSLTLIQDTISKIAQGLTLDQIAQVHDKKTETKTPADDTITFIDKLTANFINKTLTFIDPNKAVSHLSTALNSICENLNLLQTDNITVKFLCHSVHMLERVIRKEPLIYPKLNSFINQNQKTFQVIEKSFNTIEEVFGIKISSDELAYITEIFIN
ncbi:hypothetical protein SDC9_79821 [bioreactor metagenome]|uniref:PRD domain-containing protein n=1 Tax=bioreactor metagenome TaxID=1076179 RepID=A0A644YXP6_9ZZZZ